jgi:hypothetical protein
VRRLAISLALAVAAAIALPVAAAQATFHLQMANEVMLASATGDTNVRFVELYDAGGSEEVFPSTFGPFGLAIYNAAGHKLVSQGLSASGMRNAALANRPFLISTAAADLAFKVMGDETLTVSLPKSAGQACYTAMGGTPYSCITWGCITSFVSTSGTGSFHGAVPANGMSAQRQGDNTVQIATPTPKATNHAGTKVAPCPTTASPFAGVRIPTQTVTVKKGKAPVLVKCPAKAKGRCKGTLVLKTAHKVRTSSGKKKIVTLGSASFSIAAGKRAKVPVPLSMLGKNLVANHKSVSAVATATAHDGTGKAKKTSGDVTLKRSAK